MNVFTSQHWPAWEVYVEELQSDVMEELAEIKSSAITFIGLTENQWEKC